MHIASETIDNPVPNKGSLSLFPLSLNDELHVSQASRYHVNSGNRSTRISFAQLYGAAPFRHTHWVPQHLEQFARKIPGSIIVNTENLLRNNTLFPLFETFGNAILSLSEDAIPIAQQILNIPKRIVGKSGKIQLCFDCLQSDWDEYGSPYIHRSHQIPGVEICWKHGSRLLSCCPLCGSPFEQTDSPNLILAPWEPCICGHYLPEVDFWRPEQDASEVEQDFTQFAHDILVCPSKHLSASVLATLYKKHIADLGLTRKSRIDRKATVAALEEYFGVNFLAKIDFAYRTGRNQNWFSMGCESSVFEVPIARHLALAHFLFREADHFWRAAIAIQTELEAQSSEVAVPTKEEKRVTRGEPIISSPEPPIVASHTNDTVFCSEKREVDELLKQHPEWTKEDLWREHPGLIRKLLRKNADGLDWLDERLKTGSASRKGGHSSCEPNQSDDVHWVQKFNEAARAEYVSIKFPTKATCNHIMRSAGWKQPNKPDSLKFPLARKTLEDLAETKWHYYARRILWAKLTVGASASSPSSVISPSGIEHNRGIDLLTYFSTVPSTRLLQADTIIKILEENGIPRNWDGLPSNPKYYVPGRNYVAKRQK